VVRPGSNPGRQRLVSLVDQVAATVQQSLTQSSRASYHKTLSQYTKFQHTISSQGVFPLNPGRVLLYLAHLQLKGYAPSTIISKLSALNFYNKVTSNQDINTHFLVAKFISGLQKMTPTKDLRAPVTLNALYTLHTSVPTFAPSSYLRLLYQSMFSLSFYAFLRPGEVTTSPNNMEFNHVVCIPSSVAITFYRYKHHKGPPFTLVINTQNTPPCPVSALNKYLLVRGSKPGPLYVNPDGLPISYNQYSNFINRVQTLSMSQVKFHPHSFRIGAATHAAIKGVLEQDIKRMGRWESSAYTKYIRIQTFTA